jgi:hypothetical protein
MSADTPAAPVDVDRVMSELEDDVRRARRRRLLARGAAPEYRDSELYEKVDVVLRRALEARDHDALLVPDFLEHEGEWQLDLHLKWSSHRQGVAGPLLIFIKRRLLLPMFRWLWEYSLENFRTQRRVNQVLFACIEELAIENARLKQRVEGRGPNQDIPGPTPGAEVHDAAHPDPGHRPPGLA